MQFAVARDYGFADWNELKRHVLGLAKEAPGVGSKIAVEDDAVLVTGLEKAWWGGYGEQQDTCIGALTAVFQALGEKNVDYDTVMAASGSSFRLLLKQPEWHPEETNSAVGFDCVLAAADAMGYRLTWVAANVGNEEERKRLLQAVRDSVDRGYPVLFNEEECSVVTGYSRRDGSLFRRHHGFRIPQDNVGYAPVGEWPWAVAGILEKRVGHDGETLLETALDRAVMLAKTPAFGEFASGFRAYELWIEQLEQDQRFSGLPENAFVGACLSSGYAYNCLDSARKSAVRFLDAASKATGGGRSASLSRVRDVYAEMVTVMETKRDDLPEPWNLFPWDLDNAKKWTPAMRHAQANVLRTVLALERRGIAEIERALAETP
jgi:hypothetical protein